MTTTMRIAQATEPIRFLDLAQMHTDVESAVTAVWQEVLSSSVFVGGPLVERFEDEWATFCGAQHCVGVANGTDALRLILEGLGIGPGHEVIVPANTFFASCEAIVSVGATPRFVDVDADTLVVSADAVRAAIGPRTSAIMVVHLYGQMPDMDAIAQVAQSTGLALIEDAAQAHGAEWCGRPAGSFGVAAGFSFYPGKNLGAFGDAGAVVTSNPVLATRVRSLANHGRSEQRSYVHQYAGANSRLDALQAGILSAKLPFLKAWNAQRRRVMATYEERLAGTEVRPVTVAPGAQSACHLAVVEVAARDHVRAELDRCGIESGVHYPVPCHLQDPLRSRSQEPLPVSERAAERVLSLPLHPYMTVSETHAVCDAVLEAETRAPAL